MARRKHLPDDWQEIAQRRLAHWRVLDEAERDRIGECAEHLVSTKNWEAARGFALTDEIVVTIAAQASILVLGLDIDYFAKVTSIIVHPSEFSIPGPRPSAIHGLIEDGARPLLGEAHHDRGPVLLAWDQARYGARHRGNGNVVLHEFAHKIDMLDGVVDGTPLMQDRAALDRWIEVCTHELELLRAGVAPGDDALDAAVAPAADRQRDPLLRDYAATDPGEFFAVTTEVFFDQPIQLRDAKPELYEVLADFYRQDPAARDELVGKR